jgi:chromosome partitioning protein
MYRVQSAVHVNQLRLLQSGKDAPLFETIIPWNTDITEAAEHAQVSTLRQKWGYRGQFDKYRALTQEIINRLAVPASAKK